MAMFQNGDGTREWLNKKLMDGESGLFAVAFWGSGAVKQLRLNELAHGQNITVICNLAMGGTNPNEIKKLVTLPNVTVQQSDRLHGKVYRFKDSALVGSSNASANGLSFEGREMLGWHEANLVTSEIQALKDIDRWAEGLEARPISDSDLKAAQNAWRARRYSSLNTPDAADHIHRWLRNGSSSFDGRPVYVVAYCEDNLTREGKEASDEALRKYGPKVDYFEDWASLPKDGILISFYVKPDGTIVRADGLRERRSDIQALPIAKTEAKLELCFKMSGQEKIIKQENALWQNIIRWLVAQPFDRKTGRGWCAGNCGFVELSKVAAAIECGEIGVKGGVS